MMTYIVKRDYIVIIIGRGGRLEVLICVATTHEFARHGSHKPDDDLPHGSKALELR